MLCWLAAAGGAVLVLLLGFAGRHRAVYVDDGFIALNLLAGKGFTLAFHGPEAPTAAHAPLQPFLLAAVHGMLGIDSLGVLAVIILRAIAHAATSLFAYPIALRFARPKTAVLLSAMIAFHPLLLGLAGNTGHLDERSTLSHPLMLLSIWACTVAGERQRLCTSLLAGIAIGVASLSEPPLMLFGVLASGMISLGTCGWRARARTVATVLLGGVLVIGPWIGRNAIVFRHFVPIRSSFGLLLWAGNNPKATGLWEDQEIMSDRYRVTAQRGALLMDEQPTTFNFFARDTLPSSVLVELARANEVERDRILLREALTYIWNNPARFLSLTLWRSLYLMAAPPLRTNQEGGQFVGRVMGFVSDALAKWWHIHKQRTTSLGWSILRLYLFFAFVGALASALWARSPVTLLLAGILGIWLSVFGFVHSGYAVYRLTLEPFVMLCLGAVLAKASGSARTAREKVALGSCTCSPTANQSGHSCRFTARARSAFLKWVKIPLRQAKRGQGGELIGGSQGTQAQMETRGLDEGEIGLGGL